MKYAIDDLAPADLRLLLRLLVMEMKQAGLTESAAALAELVYSPPQAKYVKETKGVCPFCSRVSPRCLCWSDPSRVKF